MTTPKAKINAMAMNRSRSGEIPVDRTIDVSVSVKMVKLTIRPIPTPSGRNLPLDAPAAKTMGMMGRIHGERMVQMPARRENANRIHIPQAS